MAELKAAIELTEHELEVEQLSHRTQVKFLEEKISKATARKLLTEHINEGQTPADLKADGIQVPPTPKHNQQKHHHYRHQLL